MVLPVFDDNEEYISFLFGGPNDGIIQTTFVNLPDFIRDVAKSYL